MAEKKFFVDINLQGSALTNAKIGTNSGIGSTEGAFGYDSASHRLQYFNGTATKDVANLSDIAAVTGGLIFQGGYDPATNTPDITDGTALKGFFWAATAAGTFLGESVQVGDSIVAKVDAAGATITDWLILQGNVVIATETVDGISRLATQAEADAGTEAGAVVITPATLQGKIDAQITPEINNKLPLAGGTMSGNIDMGNNNINGVNAINTNAITTTSGLGYLSLPDINISGVVDINENGISTSAIYTNQISAANGGGAPITSISPINANGNSIYGLPTPSGAGDAANKTYVDDQDALKLSLTGGTMSGNIDMDGNTISNSGAVYTNNLASSLNTEIQLLNSLNSSNGATITNLPAPSNGGDAANKTYVDDNTSNKLPLAGGTMSGNIDMGGTASIANAHFVSADRISTNNLDGFGSDITVDNGLDFGGNNLPKNLVAPTNGGDATNKTYVDGVGATAESNANDYTDAKVSQLSYSHEFTGLDWTLVGEVYELVVTHNLGTGFILATTKYNGQFAEFTMEIIGDNELKLYSNILPISICTVSIVRADGTAPL